MKKILIVIVLAEMLRGALQPLYARERFTFLTTPLQLQLFDLQTKSLIDMSAEFYIYDYAFAGNNLFICTTESNSQGQRNLKNPPPQTPNFFYTTFDSINTSTDFQYHPVPIRVLNILLSPDKEDLLLKRVNKQWEPRYELMDTQRFERVSIKQLIDTEVLTWMTNDDLLVRKNNQLWLFRITQREFEPFLDTFDLTKFWSSLEVHPLDSNRTLFMVRDDRFRWLVHSRGVSHEIYSTSEFHRYVVLNSETIAVVEITGISQEEMVNELLIINVEGQIINRINISKRLNISDSLYYFLYMSDNTNQDCLILYIYKIVNGSGAFYKFPISDTIEAELLKECWVLEPRNIRLETVP